MKKYICDCCKKDMTGKKGVAIEVKRYLWFPECRMPGGLPFELCLDCYNQILTSAQHQRKQNEERVKGRAAENEKA